MDLRSKRYHTKPVDQLPNLSWGGVGFPTKEEQAEKGQALYICSGLRPNSDEDSVLTPAKSHEAHGQADRFPERFFPKVDTKVGLLEDCFCLQSGIVLWVPWFVCPEWSNPLPAAKAERLQGSRNTFNQAVLCPGMIFSKTGPSTSFAADMEPEN